jgi:hypothetical protein
MCSSAWRASCVAWPRHWRRVRELPRLTRSTDLLTKKAKRGRSSGDRVIEYTTFLPLIVTVTTDNLHENSAA